MVFTLLTGIIAYVIIILFNLLIQAPLQKVFINGLIGLGVVSICCWLIITLMQWLSQEQDKSFQQKNKDDINQNSNNITNNGKNQESGEDDQGNREFSPMNPKVLEVEEENN